MTLTRIKTFALAAFVADRASMDTVGTGIQIDWSKFTDSKYGTPGQRHIRAGTAVEPVTDAGAPALLCGPATGTVGRPAFLTKQHMEEDNPTEALSGHGAYNGGNVYEALLPDASGTPRVLPAAIKAQLAAVGIKFLIWEDRR